MGCLRQGCILVNTPLTPLHQRLIGADEESCLPYFNRPFLNGQVCLGQRWYEVVRVDMRLTIGKKTPESETAVAHNFTYMQPFCISNWGHWFQCSSSWGSHSRMNMHDQGPSWGRRGASDQLWPFLSAELKFGLISFVGSTKLVPPHSWRTS